MERFNSEGKSLKKTFDAKQNFDVLFRKYYAPLTYFAQSILHSQGIAEDVVADAFVKLWERPEIHTRTGNIQSYLYTTVYNACINVLRKEKVIQAHQQEVKFGGQRMEQPILHQIIRTETFHIISVAVEKLPPKCGLIFRKFYLEGKKLEEIASELNLSISTVKNQKGRALELLRKRFLDLKVLMSLIV